MSPREMRLEKGYRVWGADVTPETTPYEAGLGFAVRLRKPVEFMGKAALLEARQEGPARKLCCLVLDELAAVAQGGEPVRHQGTIAGRVTSGGYGYTVERSIAYAYLPIAHSSVDNRVEVEVFGEWMPATVAAEPLWDAQGERIKA